MSYLLDTNVISETLRPRPHPAVAAWFRSTPDDALHLSVLTLGELRKGVERLAGGGRKERLRVWLEHQLPVWFEDRLLPVDSTVADTWGRLQAAVNWPVAAIDSLLAATAMSHGLRMVTRNTAGFSFPGLEVVNPWSPAPH